MASRFENPAELPPGYARTRRSAKPAEQENVGEKERSVETRDLDRVIDTRLEFFLQTCGKVNEGRRALIFRLNLQDVPEDLERALEERGTPLRQDTAVKVLKVYRAGDGAREYARHLEVYNLFQGAQDRDGLATIAAPILFRDLTIRSERTRENLKAQGLEALGDSVEMILADYLEGKDLATVLFERVLVEHNKTAKDYEQVVIPSDFASLHAQVGRILGFRIPGSKSRNERERRFEERKVELENAELVYRFLAQRGVRLQPQLVQRLENSIRLLWREGFRHNDLHERNVIVMGERGDLIESAEGAIIDFGETTRGDVDAEGEALDDFALVRNLKKLLPQEAPGRQRIEARLAGLVERLRVTLESNQRWAERYRQVRRHLTRCGSDAAKILEDEFSVSSSDESRLYEYLALVALLAEDGCLPRAEARAILQRQRDLCYDSATKTYLRSPWVERVLGEGLQYLG